MRYIQYAGLVVETRADLLKWAWNHSLSNKLDDGCLQISHTGSLALSDPNPNPANPLIDSLEKRTDVLAIPISYDDYPATEAICMTGYTELGWLGQLVKSKVRRSTLRPIKLYHVYI